VKTATFKELAPYEADWYYIRTGMDCVIYFTSWASDFHIPEVNSSLVLVEWIIEMEDFETSSIMKKY